MPGVGRVCAKPGNQDPLSVGECWHLPTLLDRTRAIRWEEIFWLRDPKARVRASEIRRYDQIVRGRVRSLDVALMQVRAAQGFGARRGTDSSTGT
jgi:hypothetical protein